MIRDVIDLLNSDNFYGVSESIEIAKGKYELKNSIKEAYKQGKREGYGTK